MSQLCETVEADIRHSAGALRLGNDNESPTLTPDEKEKYMKRGERKRVVKAAES